MVQSEVKKSHIFKMFFIDIILSSAKGTPQKLIKISSYSSFWNEHLARLEQQLSAKLSVSIVTERTHSQLQNVSSFKKY